MNKYKALTGLAGPDGTAIAPGDVVELPLSQAVHWVLAGKVVAVKASKSTKNKVK